MIYLNALRAVRHRASAAVIELDFLKFSPTFLESLTFNNYHSEDGRDSGSRKREVSLKRHCSSIVVTLLEAEREQSYEGRG